MSLKTIIIRDVISYSLIGFHKHFVGILLFIFRYLKSEIVLVCSYKLVSNYKVSHSIRQYYSTPRCLKMLGRNCLAIKKRSLQTELPIHHMARTYEFQDAFVVSAVVLSIVKYFHALQR
jgi:hypothetical protein